MNLHEPPLEKTNRYRFIFENMTKLRIKIRKFIRQEDGQGISEYGALLAFITILVVLVFAFAPGKLGPAVSAAFSSVAQELNDEADAANAVSAASGS
jgi:Flp pilus assembly pilin Flp